MANQKRNFGDEIFSKFFIYVVCSKLGLPTKAKELENYFTQQSKKNDSYKIKTANSKWHRYESCNQRPSKRTISEVGKLVEDIRDYLEIPLWQALHTEPKSKSEWDEIYRTLPLTIQAQIYFNRRSITQRNERREVSPENIKAIYRESDHYALASLIGLFRETSGSKCNKIKLTLERHIHSLILKLGCWIPYFYIVDHLYHYVYEHFCYTNKGMHLTGNPWKLTSQEVKDKSIFFYRAVVGAKKLGIICNHDKEREFLFWLTEGPSEQIVNEIYAALLSKRPSTYLRHNHLGWLVSKLEVKLGRYRDIILVDKFTDHSGPERLIT